MTAKEQLPTSINGLLGTFNLIEEIYLPIGKMFAERNYEAITIAELEQGLKQLNYAQILNALVILCHLGLAQPCQNLAPNDQVLQRCHKLNHYLLSQASFHQNYGALISPLTGIGIPTEHFHQLFYRAHFIDGLNTATDFAYYVQDVIHQLGWLVLDKKEMQSLTKMKASPLSKKRRNIF